MDRDRGSAQGAAAGDDEHLVLMRAAVEREADAQRAALAGKPKVSRTAYRNAAESYRRSWEAAPPGSYGRLVGMLKAAVLAGNGRAAARYALGVLEDAPGRSATAAYAAAIAALVLDDDGAAAENAERMRTGSDAFARAADAIAALAASDAAAYGAALAAIVADFESREAHLTGVAIADTALMLERLATGRAMAVDLPSPLLPVSG